MPQRFAVIMAGGRGERFWPQSRTTRPKHLLPIVGKKPMLAQTVERLGGLVPPERVFILTNAEQRDAVLECCPSVPPEHVVAEPVGRDTAPAVGLATLLVKAKDPQASFAMLPADHVIHDTAAFCRVLGAAFEAAERADVLATVGIAPSEPATGYGYIRKGSVLEQASGQDVFAVERFVEKPDLATAQQYLDSGQYFWNAGMFIWTVSAIEKALATHTPALTQGLSSLQAAWDKSGDLPAALAEHFPTLEKISIDYAVIEKAQNVVTLESAFDWDDVGAWPAVANHHPKDDAGNTLIGNALQLDSTNNIVVGTDGHLTAVLGVEDLIVVQTADATLICPKSRAQDVKKLVQQIATTPNGKKLL